jgi:uncharacterized membrane protein YbjE (DUF340 family)
VFNLVIALIAGITLGYVLRKKKKVNLTRVTFGIILLLIFSLGFSIGSNNELLDSLPKVGLNAVVILAFAVGFSVLFVKAADKMVKLER